MATQRLTEETECGYCYSRGEFLTDPRELPCHHVYCLPCIKGHYSEHGNLTCSICKEVCSQSDLNSLPKVKVEKHVTRVTCDGYKCQGQTALTHCVECGNNMCSTHLQNHKALFGDSHKEVPIHVFEANPERFGKPVCEHHEEMLIRACKKCDQLICFECDIDYDDCIGLDQHEFKSLQSLKEEVNSYLEAKLHVVGAEIEVIGKLDKNMWKDFDKQERKYEDMVKEITWIRDEQMRLIQKKSEDLTKEVCKHREKGTNHVEMLYNKMVVKSDRLEEIRHEVDDLLKNGHVTEKIRLKRRIAKELDKHSVKDPDEYQVIVSPSLVVRCTDKEVGLDDIGLTMIPSTLDFSSQHETGGECYTAYFREDGDILVGTQAGVYLWNRGDGELTQCTSDINVTGVIEHGQNVYILHREGQFCKVDVCLPNDFSCRQELLRFPRTSTATMAASNKYLAVKNPDKNKLIIYNFTTKRTVTVRPAVYPVDINFIADNQLLGVGDGKLVNYRIEDEKMSMVWKCNDVVNGYSVCVDSNGLIYVSTRAKQTVYIIAPQGMLVRTLTCSELPARAGYISVRDGVLAVPGRGDKMLHLFSVAKRR